MKKRIVALVLCLCMMMTALSGCGEKVSKSRNVDKLLKTVLKDVDKYATPGEYLGVEVEVEEVTEITDEGLEEEIKNWLEYYPALFTGNVESGKTVNIDYEGSIEGELFDGGADTGYNLEIGSESFIPGFEDQLIGMGVGETKTIQVTFPEVYENNPDLAGKLADFKVTVNYIQGDAELTEDWISYVAGVEGITTDDLADYTPETFKEFVRKQMKSSQESSKESTLTQGLLKVVTDNTTFKDIPEDWKNTYIENEKEYQTSYIENNYQTTLEEYLGTLGIDEATYNSDIEATALDYMNNVLALKAIAIKEKIKVTQEEYDEYLQEYADYYGMDSIDAFEEEYSSEYGTDLFEGLLLQTVLDYLLENVKEVAVAPVATEEPEVTEEPVPAE